MKTNNFKISFDLIGSSDVQLSVTNISFGNARVSIRLYPSSTLLEKDNYRFSYYNGDRLVISTATYDMPNFLKLSIEQLYYGFFAYHVSPFYKSPAFEVIGVIRSIQNYYKRINKPLL